MFRRWGQVCRSLVQDLLPAQRRWKKRRGIDHLIRSADRARDGASQATHAAKSAAPVVRCLRRSVAPDILREGTTPRPSAVAAVKLDGANLNPAYVPGEATEPHPGNARLLPFDDAHSAILEPDCRRCKTRLAVRAFIGNIADQHSYRWAP